MSCLERRGVSLLLGSSDVRWRDDEGEELCPSLLTGLSGSCWSFIPPFTEALEGLPRDDDATEAAIFQGRIRRRTPPPEVSLLPASQTDAEIGMNSSSSSAIDTTFACLLQSQEEADNRYL